MKVRNILRIVDTIIFIGKLSVIVFGIFVLATFMAGKPAETLFSPVIILIVGSIILMFIAIQLLKYADKKIVEEQK
jgi:hypothetical protein